MEPSFRTEDTAESRNILEGQIRECYGRTVYSHKTHEKCADILHSRFSWIKTSQIILSALTTASFITTFLEKSHLGGLVGVTLSSILLVLNAYIKNYDLGELAQKHKQTANDIWLIREQYLSLLTDISMGQRPLENIQLERDNLMKDLHSIYASAPSTTSAAYKKAQKGLKMNEDMTFSDKEIDAFLPKELRRIKESQ